MNAVSALVFFIVVWWLVWFTQLPQGLQGVGDDETGAPNHPQLKRKLLITTLISAVIWLVVYYLFSSGTISLREMFQ